MAATEHSETHDLFDALKHPLRRQILREMAGEAPLSPRELATVVKEPLTNVSYHVRVLADCGAVTLVRTRRVRGSIQHFYRLSVKAEWVQEALGDKKE